MFGPKILVRSFVLPYPNTYKNIGMAVFTVNVTLNRLCLYDNISSCFFFEIKALLKLFHFLNADTTWRGSIIDVWFFIFFYIP